MKRSALLFTPSALIVHTLLFTPIVGGIGVWLNWQRLGQPKRGTTSVFIALLSFSLLILVGALVSPMASLIGACGGTIGLSVGWFYEQRALHITHKMIGGQSANPLPLTLIGLMLMTLAFLILTQMQVIST